MNGFALGILDISRLNFDIVSLIPKVQGAESIKKYRQIAMIHVIFKFIAKVMANRLSPFTHHIIATSQNVFIKGWLTLDGALALHEIIHELKLRNYPSVLVKLDFEKPMIG
jgi:hypothetical protein